MARAREGKTNTTPPAETTGDTLITDREGLPDRLPASQIASQERHHLEKHVPNLPDIPDIK